MRTQYRKCAHCCGTSSAACRRPLRARLAAALALTCRLSLLRKLWCRCVLRRSAGLMHISPFSRPGAQDARRRIRRQRCCRHDAGQRAGGGHGCCGGALLPLHAPHSLQCLSHLSRVCQALRQENERLKTRLSRDPATGATEVPPAVAAAEAALLEVSTPPVCLSGARQPTRSIALYPLTDALSAPGSPG